MEYTLKDFAGRYSCLPDSIRYITSPEGFMIFSTIYSYGCRIHNTTLVSDYISISRRTLQKETALGRIRVENAINELSNLNLLSISGDAREKRMYQINWNEIHFVDKTLSTLSYDGIEIVRSICQDESRIIPVSSIESTQIAKIKANYKYEYEQSGLKSTQCAEINPDDTDSNSKSGLILQRNNEINPDENISGQSGLKSTQEVQNQPRLKEMFTKSGLKSTQCAEINPDARVIWVEKQHEISEDEDGNLVLNVFLDKAETILVKRLGISKINLGCFQQSGLISQQSGLISTHIWVDSQPTVNIYKNKKENELTERSEVSYIGGEKEKTVEEFLEPSLEEGKDKNFLEPLREVEKEGEAELPEENFEGLEIIKLVDPISPEEHYRLDKEKIKQSSTRSNPYRNKPYFSEEAMKKLTALSNFSEVGCKSPDSLFYFNLWGGLYDWYLEEVEENLPADEYGNPVQDGDSSDLDMLGYIISERKMANIVCHAWEETIDQIEAGFVEFEEGKVDLSLELPEDFHPEYAIDWKKARTENNEPGFVISLSGFRNIQAADVTEVKSPRTKEDKRAFNKINRQFIAAVTSMDDSQLTPMEIAIKDFAANFIAFDEFYSIKNFMNGRGLPMMCRNLPGYLITPWMIKLLELGISREEFCDVVNCPGGYKDGADIQRMNTIFVYEKVKRWNEMKGFQSQITEEVLDNSILSDFCDI